MGDNMQSAEQHRFQRKFVANQKDTERSEDRPGNGRPDVTEKYDGTLLVLDERILTRECLCQSIRTHSIGLDVAACGSLEEWQAKPNKVTDLAAILVIANGDLGTDDRISALRDLVAKVDPVPVLVLADTDGLEEIVLALECGVKGYIPSSVGIAVCVEAIRLALVGGLFVPSSSVIAMRSLIRRKTQTSRPMSSMFTQRQAEVVQALRRGKANKIIAYELNMRESTVKVHIRNIMKKLKATNRTEVAYKINDLFPEDGRKVMQ